MKKRLKSVKNRIMSIFITVVVFQIIVTVIFTVYHLRPHIESVYTEHLNKTADTLFWELNNVKQKIQNYSVNIIGDSQIQNFLKRASGSTAEDNPLMTTELRNKILSYTEYDNMIKGIFLIDNHNRIYSNSVNQQIARTIEEKGRLADGARPLWCSDIGDQDIIMYRIVNNNTTDLNQKIGALCMVIDRRIFTDTIQHFILEPNQKYVIESYDKCFKMGCADQIDQNAYQTGQFLKKQDRYISYFKDNESWFLLTWVDKETVYAPVYTILEIIFIEMFALLVVTVGLIAFLSGRITRPILDLSMAARKIGQGNVGIEVEVKSQDEIGELAATINHMSKRLKELIAKIKDDQEKQRLLELKAMQYQINPHFLYNTLDSINMFARKNNDLKSSELVMALTNFFRIGLSQGREFIKIKDEVQYALYYIRIQNIRFPDQIEWEINMHEELENLYVMKFILQPLVENSINHGIRNDGGKGRIIINVFKEKEDIVFEIIDNGIGIMPDRLERIKQAVEEEECEEKDLLKGGFGMRNVHQRLKLCYGAKSGLQIESWWEEGTKITIHIPIGKAKQIMREGKNIESRKNESS